MSILKTIIQGDSVTIGFRPNAEYNQSHMSNYYVHLGSELLSSILVDGVIRVELTSEQTAKYFGTLPLWLCIDDVVFGHRNTYIGDLNFKSSTGTVNDASIDTGYTILVDVLIDELTTVTNVLLFGASFDQLEGIETSIEGIQTSLGNVEASLNAILLLTESI